MSTTTPTFDEETWAVFEDDAQSSLREIESSLLKLEDDPSDAAELNSLFRGMHTLKGSSGFLGLNCLSKLAHSAEDLVSLVRDGTAKLDGEMVDVLLATLDILRVVVDESSHGPVENHAELIAPTCARLAALTVAAESAGDSISPNRGLQSADEILDACEALVPAVLAAAQDCARGKQTIPDSLGESLERLRLACQGLEFSRVVHTFNAVHDALKAGHGRILALLWAIALERLRGHAQTRIVLFGMDMEEPIFDDPALTRVFFESIASLVGPLVHEVDAVCQAHTGADGLLEVLRECRAACAALEHAQLIEVLADLEAHAVAVEPDSSALKAAVNRLAHELEPMIERWQSATDSDIPSELNIPQLIEDAWRDGAGTYRGNEVNLVVSSLSGIAPGGGDGESVEANETAAKGERPPPDAGPAGGGESTKTSKFLRVEATKVESLMALAGQIGLAVGSVLNLDAFKSLNDEDLNAGVERMEGLIRELQDISSGIGLVPLSSVFGRMNRLARDLRQQTGKNLILTTTGGDAEIDKTLVEALVDPLIHLVRNAADHGIESSERRLEAGKPEVAQICISAKHSGDSVVVTVEDDGAGMNRAAILDRAVSRGLVTAAEGESWTDTRVWNLVFEPGFSTVKKVSDLSGRGIGMDVVKTAIQAVRGRVTIQSTPGKGTRVQLRLPMTLAFLDGMVISVGGCCYVVPVSAVHRVFRVEEDDIVGVPSEGVTLIHSGNDMIPALSLEEFFSGQTSECDYIGQLVVVVQTDRGQLAIPIDKLVGQEQVTLKPLVGFLSQIRAGVACALLRSGGIAIALDCEQLHDFRADRAA